MDEMQLLGYAVTAIITLGGFIAVIMKFTQPINELRVVIQKLLDKIDSISKDNDEHGRVIAKHGEDITKLGTRVDKLETRMDIYHQE